MATDSDLALAAKALLRSLRWDVSKHIPLDDDGVPLDWDPRLDSGQSLDLAAHLDISLEFDDVMGVQAIGSAGPFTTTTDGALSKVEATRDAIFRAAVAIGRTMP